LQVLARGGLTFGTREDAEYTEEKGRVLLWRGRSVSKLISSWRGLSLSVRLEEGAASLGHGGTMPLPSHGHTTGVLVFSGMKGNPLGGVLFNHVPFSQAR
jgi:hypothetical protein